LREQWEHLRELAGTRGTGRASLEHVLALAAQQGSVPIPAPEGGRGLFAARRNAKRRRREGRFPVQAERGLFRLGAIREVELPCDCCWTPKQRDHFDSAHILSWVEKSLTVAVARFLARQGHSVLSGDERALS